MTRRRRTANPIFQKPLTTAEAEGKQVIIALPKYLSCHICGSIGGTLVKIDEGIYVCRDKEKCRVMSFKRR